MRCDLYTKCNGQTPNINYTTYLKVDAHKGMVKYGENWYKDTAVTAFTINPLDRFADEFNESIEEFEWAGREVGWWYDEASDLTQTIYLMLKGFTDDGFSFE